MKKSIICILLLLALTLAACGGNNGVISEEEAFELALQELQLDEDDVTDIHTHKTTYEEQPCYNIHITTEDGEYEVYISATGEILRTKG